MLSLYMLTLSKYDPLCATHTYPSWRDDLHLGHGVALVLSHETIGWEPLKVYLVVNVYENLG
jgi:hypothetical protein